MNDEKIYDKLEEHSIQLAKLEESFENLEKHIDDKFDRLDLWFKEIEKNSDFRKRTTGGLKVLVVIVPILAAIIILL